MLPTLLADYSGNSSTYITNKTAIIILNTPVAISNSIILPPQVPIVLTMKADDKLKITKTTNKASTTFLTLIVFI